MLERRAALLALPLMLVAACSGPKLLSTLDSIDGGGSGSREAAQNVVFGTHGQKLDVYVPNGPVAGTRPMLVFFYGGGWVGGTRAGYAFAARAYAANGFVVVLPDYRKVPDVRYPAFLVDGAQAVKWAHDHAGDYGGDPGRLALAGHSAGAYTVAMLTLDKKWLAAEGLGPKTVKAAVGLNGPYDFYPFTAKRAIDAFAGVTDGPATQPINYASADAPPMLIVTSTKDTIVRPYNAVHLYDRLKAKGATAVFKEYQGLTHQNVAMALSKPFRGKAPVLADSVTFLNRHLGPVRQP